MASYTIMGYLSHALPNEYRNYVMAKWMRSYRYGNDYIKLSDSDSYFEAYNSYINIVLMHPSAIVRIAALADDPDVALGFSVCRDTILDYVWVHKDNRKQGIGGFLVPPNIEAFTHLTRVGLKLWPLQLPGAKFKPFL